MSSKPMAGSQQFGPYWVANEARNMLIEIRTKMGPDLLRLNLVHLMAVLRASVLRNDSEQLRYPDLVGEADGAELPTWDELAEQAGHVAVAGRTGSTSGNARTVAQRRGLP